MIANWNVYWNVLTIYFYRSYRPETPSNPGGVSHSAREKIKQRGERDRDKGIYAESRSNRKHESSSKSRDRDRPSRRHDNDNSSSERRDRKSERKQGRAESSKRYADWEETPSSRYSEDDRKTTPRIRYNGIIEVLYFCKNVGSRLQLINYPF